MLGATYATLFPGRVRAMALDGPLDVDVVTRRPLEEMREDVVSFEAALDRFARTARPAPPAGSAATIPRRRWTLSWTGGRCRPK
jgi:pimeloyl-ACP methyl ester carboxylesterase